MNAALADALLVLHGAFVLFVVAGGVLVFVWPRVAWMHVPAAAWGALVELTGWICPLTPWETRLRGGTAGDAATTDFIERVLTPIIYPGWLTRELQLMMGGGVLLLNALVYGIVLVRWRSGRARSPLSR